MNGQKQKTCFVRFSMKITAAKAILIKSVYNLYFYDTHPLTMDSCIVNSISRFKARARLACVYLLLEFK